LSAIILKASVYMNAEKDMKAGDDNEHT